MNLTEVLCISPEISAAVRGGKPVVALESAALSHGTPWPDNLEFALRAQQAVQDAGAAPATMAVIDGVLKVGLTHSELERLCRGEDVAKMSRRDLPVMVAQRRTGAATVSASMILASLAGIRVLAAGCVGGARRRDGVTLDVSADLQELRQTSVAVVCSGVQPDADIGMTLEYLETMGVPVLGLRTDSFPALYCRASGFALEHSISDETEAARIAAVKWDLGLAGGLLIATPVPEAFAMRPEDLSAAVQAAQAETDAAGVRGKDAAPYLLERIRAHSERALETRGHLLCSNARAAGRIAAAMAEQYHITHR